MERQRCAGVPHGDSSLFEVTQQGSDGLRLELWFLIVSFTELYAGHMPEELEMGVPRWPWGLDLAAIFLGPMW